MPTPSIGRTHAVAHALGFSQSFTMATAVRGPVAYGPHVSQPNVVIPDLVPVLYRRTDLATEIVRFDDSHSRRWIDQLNEPGSGSIVVQNDDADLASIGDGDVIRFDLHGEAAMAILVRQREQATIAGDEEHGQTTILSGPGTLAIYDEAVIYPTRGVGSSPVEEDRLFSWQSADYDDSAWGRAAELCLVVPGSGYLDPAGSQVAPPSYWEDVGTKVDIDGIKPFALSKWIWAPGSVLASAPLGTCYVRQTFYVASATSMIFYGIADNELHLYVDGQQIIDTLSWEFDPTDVKKATVYLDAGWHVCAASGTNLLGASPPANPAGIAIAAHLVDDTGTISTTPTLWSDRNWLMLAYPPEPPGMTPGEVIRIVTEEARTRGALPDVDLAFDDDVDSDGVPWPIVGDISTRVGTDCLTFLRELAQTYIDMWMSPGSWTLHAWVRDGRGTDTAITLHAPTDTNDPTSGNLAALNHRRAL